MIRLTTLSLVCLVLAWCTKVSAQEVQISTKKETIGNTEYYLHTVNPGQTIYGISKAYTVSMDEIMKSNPELKKGLRAGDVIKIPVLSSNQAKKFISHEVVRGETLYEISFNYNVKVSEILSCNPGLSEKLKPGSTIQIPVAEKKIKDTVPATLGLYIVRQGETIYSIARLYATTIDELKKINPGLTETIQVGQQIRLPFGAVIGKTAVKDSAVKKDSVILIDCGKSGMNNTYRIALLIPFYLDRTGSIDTADGKTPISSHKSLNFIQFYEGVRIAIDSLRQSGLSLMIYVYDVHENTDAQDFVNQKTEMKNMDLIIGPFFMNNFTHFADWAKNRGINIVNPFTKKESALENNPHAFKIVASDSSQAAKVLGFIAETYPGSNVIVVHRNADSSLVRAFDANASAINQGRSLFIYHSINYSGKGFAALSDGLKSDVVNVVITLAQGEAFVSAYIRNLNEAAHKYKIVLFGMPSWEQYPSLDLEYLMNLNLHIFDNYFIDYNKPETADFIKKFRRKYSTEPDYYGYQGYDLMMYFSNALGKYGENFQQCLEQYNPALLETEFVFRKTMSGGYENTGCMIYRYEDYKIINALLNPKKEINLVEKKRH
ncbi:MAG TPA: LysM peptidoglycan-binding domain-containing protein [Bacteroidales bacterium]|nr:LysM peptidoglycan-binding domain-containing protein [Bacteroidales bacterium]